MENKSSEEGSNKILLPIVLVAVLIIVGYFFYKSQVDTGAQTASSLSSKSAEEALNASKANDMSTVDAKKIEEFKKQITKASKNITVSVDTDPNSELNTDTNPTTGLKIPSIFDYNTNHYNPFVFVSSFDTQKLVLANVGPKVELRATNRVQIIGDMYWDQYISPWGIQQHFVGKSKENPTLGYYNFYPMQILLSSNATLENINIAYPGGSYGIMQMIKIPAGQFIKITVKTTVPDSATMYPDTYISEILKVALVHGSLVYQGPNGLTIDSQQFNFSNELGVSSNKTNELLITGETNPYLLKYPIEPITENSVISIEGARLGSQVTVHAKRYSFIGSTDFTFTVNTSYVSTGRKSFSFAPIQKGINLSSGDNFVLKVENVTGGGVGESNQIGFQVQ